LLHIQRSSLAINSEQRLAPPDYNLFSGERSEKQSFDASEKDCTRQIICC